MQPTYQSHHDLADIPPLTPCVLANIVCHLVKLGTRAPWWGARRLRIKVMPLKEDLFEAMPGPVLAEFHPF